MRVSDSPGKGSSSDGEEESRHHVVLDESTEWSAVFGNQILVVGGNLREGRGGRWRERKEKGERQEEKEGKVREEERERGGGGGGGEGGQRQEGRRERERERRRDGEE